MTVYTRRMRWLCVVSLILGVAERAATAPPRHLYLVVVDGLDPRHVTAERMPALFDPEVTGGRVVGRALGSMPARTNPNHASLLTGVHPDGHGITGNAYWRRGTAVVDKLEVATALEVETLFSAAEHAQPALVTVGVFAKPKLGKLFGAAGAKQPGPDVVWSPEAGPDVPRDTVTGYATDAVTMDALLAIVADREPDLLAVNLADVDRTAHAHGPDAAECVAAVRGADRSIRRLVDDLRARGRWSRSIVIVTADHGFDTIASSIALGPALAKAGIEGVKAVGDGGIEHVYAETIDAGTSPLLERVAAVARAMPEVAEVLARIDVPGVPRLGMVHPDWHLDHERTGEFVLVARRGHDFVESRGHGGVTLLGNHGGPGERLVPLVAFGGGFGGVMPNEPPTSADVGATIGALLAIPPVGRIDGALVSPEARGKPIAQWLSAP